MIDRLIQKHKSRLLYRLFLESVPRYSRLYFCAVLAMIVVAITTALTAWIMRDVIDELLAGKNMTKVWGIAAFVAAIFTAKGLATYVQTYFLSRAGNGIVATAQRKIYHRLIRQSLAYFGENSSSELLVKLTHNAQAAREVIDKIVTAMVRDILTLLGLIVVMFIQQPLLALVAFLGGPIILLVVRSLLKKVRNFMEMELFSLGQIIQIMQETSLGIKVIKAFSLEEKMQSKMNAAVSSVEAKANSIARLQAISSPLVETMSGLTIASVIGLSGTIILQNGDTPGELVSFIAALLLAYEPAKRLARLRIGLEAGMVGVRRMFELLDDPIELTEARDAKDLPARAGPIMLENVSFAYAPAQAVLKGVSITFEQDQMTALVGHSGSGKSTIINLIMRMYDPSSGVVSLRGTDLKGVSFTSLRAAIAYVGQDTFLFDTTIRENIGFGREGAGEAEIIAAAKMANAHDFITAQDLGYDTLVGENGNKLSGGQKQRVAIARAMLSDSDILILDEATSALDSESELLVREALDRLTRGKTTIVIAHRLSTVAKADKIVVLAEGKVVEEGKQEALLKNGGAYAKLYHAQFNA